MRMLPASENDAFLLLGLRGRARAQDGSNSLVEDALEVALCKSRALHVLDCLDLLGDSNGLLVLDRCHLLLSQTFLGAFVIAKIELGSDQDNGNTGCVMLNLGVPLGLYVVKRRRADDGEADEEDVGLGVRERTKTVVILLTSSIPETKTDRLAIDHDTCGVVVEDSRNVFAGEGISRVRDQETGLADSTISCDDTFERLCLRAGSHCEGVPLVGVFREGDE